MEAAFARAGVHSADEVRTMGSDAAYACLIASGMRPHFIGYYALVMGLQGRPWNDARGDEKVALRARFDAIKAMTKPAPHKVGFLPRDIEQALDAIGVRSRGG